MNHSYKFRVYPNKTQQRQIEKFFEASDFVYNYYLQKIEELYKTTKRTMTGFQCCKDLTSLKKEKTFLKEVDNSMLQNTIKLLAENYHYFLIGAREKKPLQRESRRREKSYITSCSYPVSKGVIYPNIVLKDGRIKIPKIGEVKFRDKRKSVDGRIIRACIRKTNTNKFFIILTCSQVEGNKKYPITGKKIGIDLGIKDYVITSDGNKFPKIFSPENYKIASLLQSHLRKKVKGSNNYQKTLVKMARKHEKIRNKAEAQRAVIITYLLTNYDIVFMESLATQDLLKSKYRPLRRNISRSGWGLFKEEITARAENCLGKKIVLIDRFFPSSQTCQFCGYKNQLTKDLKTRTWICPSCGAKLDRDINAAVNIFNEGIRTLNN